MEVLVIAKNPLHQKSKARDQNEVLSHKILDGLELFNLNQTQTILFRYIHTLKTQKNSSLILIVKKMIHFKINPSILCTTKLCIRVQF